VASKVILNMKAFETGKVKELSEEDNLFGEYNNMNIKNGVVYEVPIGNAMGTPLLANLGPKVPVRVKTVGSVYYYIKTDIKEYGINNALVTINIVVIIKEGIQLPMVNETFQINSVNFVTAKMIQGKIPSYFSGANDQKLALPIVSK